MKEIQQIKYTGAFIYFFYNKYICITSSHTYSVGASFIQLPFFSTCVSRRRFLGHTSAKRFRFFLTNSKWQLFLYGFQSTLNVNVHNIKKIKFCKEGIQREDLEVEIRNRNCMVIYMSNILRI